MRSLLPLLLLALPVLAQEGWEKEEGARTGDGPWSEVVTDEDVRRGGEPSLRFHADAETRRFAMLTRTASCGPGKRVLFTVEGRCRGLRREGRQYENANGLLIFLDAQGRRLGLVTTHLLRDDRDWVALYVHALAPPGTASVKYGLFSSVSGTAWFAQPRLVVTHTEPRDREARAAAYEALRLHLARTYPYWDLPGKPPPEKLVVDLDDENPARAVLRMLAPLQDVHLWLVTPQGLLPTVRGNPHPPNWNEKAIRARLTRIVLDAPPHLAGLIGDVGYLRIGSFAAEGFGKVEEALDALAGARALVLDVRSNGGGDENLARRIAGRFTGKEVAYAQAQVRDPSLPGLTGFFPPVRRILAAAGDKPDTRKVAVLQGPYCVSSTEAFLCMMGQLDHVVRVGLPSRGSSGNPAPFPLFDDIAVWVPTWRGMTIGGDLIEGAGVAPDEKVDASHAHDDPTLTRALELLH